VLYGVANVNDPKWSLVIFRIHS